METLGSFIRKNRLKKKLTMQELADIMNVSYPTVSKWELDKGAFKLEYVGKLSKALDVPLSELQKFINSDWELQEFDVPSEMKESYDLMLMRNCVAAAMSVFEEKGVEKRNKDVANMSYMLFKQVERKIREGKEPIIDVREIYDLV